MKILFETKTIEMYRAELERASKYGSREYSELLAIIRELPDFKIEVKKVRRAYETYCPLSYRQMEIFIAENRPDLMDDFRLLRSGFSYNEVREWFLYTTRDDSLMAA